MPPFAILNLNYPKVRIAFSALADIPLHVRLNISERARRQIQPNPLALAVARRSVKTRFTIQRRDLHQHSASIDIALLHNARERPRNLRAADQGAGPKISLQFVHCRRSPEFNNLSLTFHARMRFILLALALGTATTASATENARTAFVERRGLMEADAQCRLFEPSIRAALGVGVAQARGALLREGWTNARLRELEAAAVNAARSRRCGDERTETAAADARRSFAQWANAGTMDFRGWDRSWRARRSADPSGWRLSQDINAPILATFGVRQTEDVQHLTLIIPLANGVTAPTSVHLIMRDQARVQMREIALPQRISQGLEAGLPSPMAAASTPSARAIERHNNQQFAVFTFPDTAFRDLVALDPRESVELRLETGRATQSLLVEVGDIAAARAFLTLRR